MKGALVGNNIKETPSFAKDPSEMTLKERMALFERNKGEAVVPKSFHIPISTKKVVADKENSIDINEEPTSSQDEATEEEEEVEVEPQGLEEEQQLEEGGEEEEDR